jgi:hypothetical protein
VANIFLVTHSAALAVLSRNWSTCCIFSLQTVPFIINPHKKEIHKSQIWGTRGPGNISPRRYATIRRLPVEKGAGAPSQWKTWSEAMQFVQRTHINWIQGDDLCGHYGYAYNTEQFLVSSYSLKRNIRFVSVQWWMLINRLFSLTCYRLLTSISSWTRF